MGYYDGKPNGLLYLGKIKWDNTQQNQVLFNSKADRDKFFTTNFNMVKDNVIYYDRNTHIDIDGSIKEINNINYAFFTCDSDIENKDFICCFIKNFEYISPKTTRLYVELDVFQTYIYDTTFYKSFIERAHIPKKLDIIGYNTLPEPLGYSCDYKKEIDIFNNLNWDVYWVAQTLSTAPSLYDENHQDQYYIYGGTGIGENYTGTFGFSLGGDAEGSARNLLERYYKNGDVTDHRSDIINVVACPEWVLHPHATKLDERGYLSENPFTNVNDVISVNTDTLACGYKPKNKKMLTSLCRVYIIFNRNGFIQPFKPELFINNTANIKISKRVLNSDSFKFFIDDYKGLDKNYFSVPYNATVNISFNENVGTQQALKAISGVGGLVGGIVGSGVSFASGNIVGGATTLFNTALNGYSNIKSAFEQVTANIGSATDTSSVIPSNIKLRLLDASPLYQECEELDHYLDLYGYNISEVNSPWEYMNNRREWNYIKTNNINLSCPAPTDYTNTLKDIFNNGITIWHNYNNFGNYNLDNN